MSDPAACLRSRGIGIAVALAVIALLVSCDEPVSQVPAIRPVRVVLAEPVDVADALSQTGEIQARYEINLGFRIGGKIIARNADIGAAVAKGDLLARLDDQPTKSEIQSRQAGLAAAEAEFNRAQAEEGRQSTLLKDGFTTRQQYETAVRDRQTAEAQREAAEAKLTLALEHLDYTELRADVDGVVTEVLAEAGQVVAAGERVLKIAQLGEREAVFDVPEVAFRLVPHDPAVEVSLVSDPEIKTVGHVRYAAPQADPITRTYSVRISLPDAPAEMRLGATVKGRVELPAQNVIELPGSALFEQDGKPAVWVFDNATHRVHLKPVTVLRFDAERVLVSAGVDKGDLIVSAGTHLLRPDEQVRLLASTRQ